MGSLWQPYVSFWRQYRLTILVVVAIAALSVGGLYARGQPLDFQLFRVLNESLRSRALDILGLVTYALGTFWFSLGLLVVLYALDRRRFAASGLGASVVGALLILVLKYLTNQPRPVAEVPGGNFVGIVTADLSYPSGHAAQSFLMAYLLARYFTPRWYAQAGLYILASLIALARVYVGAHLPADILVGALIGLLVGVLWVHSRLWPGAVRGRGPRGRGP